MIRRGPKGVLVFSNLSKKALFSFYLFASFFPERLHDHTHLYYQWPFTTGAATELMTRAPNGLSFDHQTPAPIEKP